MCPPLPPPGAPAVPQLTPTPSTTCHAAQEREILPKVFKHSNFASFVRCAHWRVPLPQSRLTPGLLFSVSHHLARQLNNYGFRKCHTDRYEFGVPGFQRGNPELLKSLKRHDAQRGTRKPSSSLHRSGSARAAAPAAEDTGFGFGTGSGAVGGGSPPPRAFPSAPAPELAASSPVMELGVYGGMQSEVDQLKRDRLLLLQEVMRLREAQTHTTAEVRQMQQRMQQAEAVQAQVLTFLQQHISPTILSANSHFLMPGRKRRHLLMPPSPGRDGDIPGSPGSQDMEALGLGLSLQELPSDHLRGGLTDDAIIPAAPSDVHGSFMHTDGGDLSLSSVLAPPQAGGAGFPGGGAVGLPVTLAMPPPPVVTPPSLESLELSDALFNAQLGLRQPVDGGGLNDPLPFVMPQSPLSLSRMASGDIESILHDLQLTGQPVQV